jgi:hypothetical protein
LRLQPLSRRLRLHPGKFRQLMAEPGELPLGVVAGVGAALFRRLFQRDLSREVGDQPGHAMGLHRRQQGIEISRGKARDLFQSADLQHRIETSIDPRIEKIAFGREKHRSKASRRQRRR